jgi:hypothetical protein
LGELGPKVATGLSCLCAHLAASLWVQDLGIRISRVREGNGLEVLTYRLGQDGENRFTSGPVINT